MQSSHLIFCRHLLFLPPIPSSTRVFSNESTFRMRWPKYWSVSFSISPSNEHPERIFLGWTGWISLQSKGLSRVFSNTTFKSINFSTLSFLHSPPLTSIHDHWKNHSLDWDLESGKESVCNAGDLVLIPGCGRFPGEENGFLLQYYCLENSMTEESSGLQSMGLQRVRHD